MAEVSDFVRIALVVLWIGNQLLRISNSVFIPRIYRRRNLLPKPKHQHSVLLRDMLTDSPNSDIYHPRLDKT